MPLRSAAFCALAWLLCKSSAKFSPTAPLLRSKSRGFSRFSIQLSTFVLLTSSSATCNVLQSLMMLQHMRRYSLQALSILNNLDA